mmetsp:Transcript_52101/g.161681  ORF Transcript_52101/g.161681 Transcript_52101/m.161681 type:complete len:261 (+) Transcript_52101:431-1213(+)
MIRLHACALVKRTTLALATSLDHQATKSSKDTWPSRDMSSSSTSASMSRWMPSSARAACSSSGSSAPPASTSTLSKTICSCGRERECIAWLPSKMLLRERKTCSDSSSQSAHSATPRTQAPSLGATTDTAPLGTASRVRSRNGGSSSVRPFMPAVRPVGMMIILSTRTVAAMVLMCPSMRRAHSWKSGVPGCGGVNFEPTIQPDIEALHDEVKSAFNGLFRTRLPSLKRTAPMCCPKVQTSTSWSRQTSWLAQAPKTSSS